VVGSAAGVTLAGGTPPPAKAVALPSKATGFGLLKALEVKEPPPPNAPNPDDGLNPEVAVLPAAALVLEIAWEVGVAFEVPSLREVRAGSDAVVIGVVVEACVPEVNWVLNGTELPAVGPKADWAGDTPKEDCPNEALGPAKAEKPLPAVLPKAEGVAVVAEAPNAGVDDEVDPNEDWPKGLWAGAEPSDGEPKVGFVFANAPKPSVGPLDLNAGGDVVEDAAVAKGLVAKGI
jgi:hypothetical protein